MTREDMHWIGLSDLVANDMRRRVESLSHAAKKRPKLVGLFPHWIKFEPAYTRTIGKKAQKSEVISLLEQIGSPQEVLLLDPSSAARGQWKRLGEAIEDCFGCCSGEIVSCLPGKLLFHEAGEPELRAVIFKPE